MIDKRIIRRKQNVRTLTRNGNIGILTFKLSLKEIKESSKNKTKNNNLIYTVKSKKKKEKNIKIKHYKSQQNVGSNKTKC